MSTSYDINRIEKTLSRLPSWEERYRFIIDFGRKLPPMDDALKVESNRVEGCVSQVWLYAKRDGDVITFTADSDAMIVKGLVHIAITAFSGQKAADVAAADPEALFARLKLEGHLTPNRRNGFVSLISRMKALAA